MGGQNTTTTTETGPWKGAQPFFKDLYGSAQNAFNATNNQTYGPATLAAPTPAQLQSIAQMKAAAPQLSAGADPLQSFALSQLNGDWLSPDTNPYIGQVANAAIAPLQTAFNQNVGAIKDRSIASGAYGGARQDLQENRASDDFTRAAGDVTAGIYGNNYAREREYMQQSPQLLQIANALRMAGPGMLGAAGAQEQGFAQAGMDDQFSRWMRSMQAPWAGIPEMANVLTAGGYSSGSSTAPAPSVFSQILQGGLGGASTGASLAQGIGGVAAGAGMGAFAPWMIPMGLLGGLAGAIG